MNLILFSLLILFFSYCAGFIGALTGLGGGVVVIPVLVSLFGIDIHFAMGASLVSVIATSSGSAAAYMRGGHVNLRIGLFLEVAAVIGALLGALLIAYVSKTFLALAFSFILFFSAYLTLKRREESETYLKSHPWATYLKLDAHLSDERKINYKVQNVPIAFFLMTVAGMISGLLGIGSGALKVLAMDQALKLPYKVATATSNFMIGITAAVSAGIYFTNGYILPAIAFPVMIGVLLGSFSGSRILVSMRNKHLRIIFSLFICFIALQMVYEALWH